MHGARRAGLELPKPPMSFGTTGLIEVKTKKKGFIPPSKEAIETVIYCHEIIQAKSLNEIYNRVTPDILAESLPLKEEVENISKILS